MTENTLTWPRIRRAKAAFDQRVDRANIVADYDPAASFEQFRDALMDFVEDVPELRESVQPGIRLARQLRKRGWTR